MNVRIVTKSLLNSEGDGKCLRSRAGEKTLRVDLSGEHEVRWRNQYQIELNAKVLTDLKGTDVVTSIQRCELFRNHVFLLISDYPNHVDSLRLTDGVINGIYVVFKAMRRCEKIIINCKQGHNRSPMAAARLAALIAHGKNSPCEEAYQFYLQLCKHVTANFDCKKSWPNLCTTHWTLNAVCEFNSREGRKYLQYGQAGLIHVDQPEGELNCENQSYDSDMTEPFDIESQGDDTEVAATE